MNGTQTSFSESLWQTIEKTLIEQLLQVESSQISFIADNKRKTGRSQQTQAYYMMGLLKFRIK